jgi:NADH:ubiquinone oxidoreductase subunit 5 (subunit L)/multisubunit Na+/H+ antiporter MnhA subunit
VFVTAFYSFRMYFLVFHGEERFRHKPFPGEHDHATTTTATAMCTTPHESPWVVTAPLVLLAIPSVVIGFLTMAPMLFGDFFKDAITVDAAPPGDGRTGRRHFHGAGGDGAARVDHAAVLAGGGRRGHGLVFYLKAPAIPAAIDRALSPCARCSRTSTTWTGSTRTCWRRRARPWAPACGRAATRPDRRRADQRLGPRRRRAGRRGAAVQTGHSTGMRW